MEREIIPLYYQWGRNGYSHGWIEAIKNSIAQIAPHYTMKRQLDDYYEKFYNKEAKRFHLLSADDNAKAKELVAWKESVVKVWNDIKITEFHKDEEISNSPMFCGKKYNVTVKIDEQGLEDALGAEMVILTTNKKNEDVIYKVIPFDVVKREGNIFTFSLKVSIDDAGSFKLAYRYFPKHPLMAHRQEFCYVTWF